jgi:hypothetical protein
MYIYRFLIKKRFFIAAALLLSNGIIYVANADSNKIQDSWTVRSVYQNPITGRETSIVVWEYHAQNMNSQEIRVKVSDKDQRVGSRAEFFYTENMRLIRANRYQKVQQREIKQTINISPEQPAILDDFLVPGNWINGAFPVEGENREKTIDRKISSNTKISRKVIISGKVMDVDKAIQYQMIDKSVTTILKDSPLVLIRCEEKVTNDENNIIIEQLWSPTHFFWIYEKTPTRTSWLILE